MRIALAAIAVLAAGCDLYFGSSGDHSIPDANRMDGQRAIDSHVAIDGGAGGIGNPPSALDFDSLRDTGHRNVWEVASNTLAQLTDGPGVDKQPAPSGDGRYLAFASDRGGSMQIYVLDRVLGATSQLTSGSADADEPSFSHDDSRIAYHRGNAVYVMDADGRNAQVVADAGSASPDAYEHPRFTADDAGLVFDRVNEIDACNLDGSSFHSIVANWTTDELAPVLDGGGDAVAYQVQCEGDAFSVWIVPAAESNQPCTGIRVTSPAIANASHPAWSLQGYVAFELGAAGSASNASIAFTTADSSGPQPFTLITAGGYDDRDPAWVPPPPL
jgi:Tol biopolymer transport system component|nr:hypothetical protein [Kofleriaceae bacterium]